MARGGFDAVIGNPPFIENRVVKKEYWLLNGTYSTEDAGNLYALCMERCAKSLAKSYFSMIVPNGLAGLDDALCIRNYLIEQYTKNWFSGYAIRPAKLFEGVDQRLCIFVGHSSATKIKQTFVGGYRHWSTEERSALFSTLRYQNHLGVHRLGRLPQVASFVASEILKKIDVQSKKVVKSYFARVNAHVIHYHRSPRYWIRAMDFEPHFRSATKDRSVHHFRDLAVVSADAAASICCLINSTLFFFWFVTLGNGRNITGRDVEEFPLGIVDELGNKALLLSNLLMASYKKNSFVRSRIDCEFQEFRPSLSKPEIDEIDVLLAWHFGFTAEELDYIINYDIKYRMGQGMDDNDD